MIKYSAKVTQDTVPPSLIVNAIIDDLYPCTVTWNHTSTGTYVGTCLDINLQPCLMFDPEMPPKWFLNSSTGEKYVVVAISRSEIQLVVYDQNGNEHDGLLTGAYIEYVNPGIQ